MDFQNFPKNVRIIEVGPRDGLQNEPDLVATEVKVEFIKRLADAGLKTIEATSFVRPDRIPQMKDSRVLFPQLISIPAELPCLVPNEKGLEVALSLGVKEIAVFTATSDSFNQKNINATVKESLERLSLVMKRAKSEGLRVRGYVSTVFGCPYEGETSTERLIEVIKFLFDGGAYEISLGDTIGCGTPKQVDRLLSELKKHTPLSRLALHFHDTRGMALANVLVGLTHGIQNFDSSAGGLGGCPYARGASGNVATEDMVYLLHSLGIQTGIDLHKLAETSQWLMNVLKRETSSKFLQAYLNAEKKLIGPFP